MTYKPWVNRLVLVDVKDWNELLTYGIEVREGKTLISLQMEENRCLFNLLDHEASHRLNPCLEVVCLLHRFRVCLLVYLNLVQQVLITTNTSLLGHHVFKIEAGPKT